jgi:hypothetical protein
MAEEFNHQELASSLNEGLRLDAELGSGTTEAAAFDAAGNPIDALCGVYRRVRPALAWVSNFPLVPANIRRVLRELLGLLDRICGINS